MLKNNICKFIPESIISEREISNFIYEKNPCAMAAERTLETNRLCLITREHITFSYNGRSVRGSAGDIIFLFESEVCCATPDAGAEYMYISFKGTRYDDLLRRFSFEMYIFALSVFCAVARNYSAKRNALITAYFRPTGIYLDFSFKIAEIYAERELKSYSTELVKFHEKLFAYKADSEISQADGMINLRIYPFVYKSEYSDIKDKKKKTFKRE